MNAPPGKCEGCGGIGNHHFPSIIVKTGSVKNHQWMQSLRGKLYDEQDHCMVSKCFSTCLIVAWGNRSYGETGQCLDLVIKINITNERYSDVMCLLI